MEKFLIKLLFVFSISSSLFARQINPLNMAYVEVNSNRLGNVGCYVRADTKKPFIDIVAIFAANINGRDPNKPEIYFNPQVTQLLDHTMEVANLKKQGIKVLLTLLGNHQNAGWSCMTDENAIDDFANKIVHTVNQYQLDGVDIDDEYSACAVNDTSMIRLARAIKTHPAFNGKLLTKALFSDYSYFSANYQGMKLADFLDYGGEMTYYYTDFDRRLSPYVNFGMQKQNLLLGVSTDQSQQDLSQAAAFVRQNFYRGMMIYNVTNASARPLNQLANAQNGTRVLVLPDCLD